MKTQLIVQNQNTYQVKPQVKKVASESNTAPSSQQSPSFVKSSSQGIELAQKLQSDIKSTIYDQPDYKTSKAIGTYMAISNQQRRNEVESLIGVNVYA